jgi:restriction system protein
MPKEKLSRSRELASRLIFAALQVLKESGGQAPGREVIAEVEKRVDLDDWATAIYEKSGYVRWYSILQFYSIDCIKAGFLIKKKGVWYLTPEGESAIKLGAVELLETAADAYAKWKQESEPARAGEAQEVAEASAQGQEAAIHEIEQQAIEGLKRQVDQKNPYEFQELVAALLRGMGYYTPFVAPKGKDGGVDVIAYRDPLGTISPRIKVQVKHRDNTATVQEVRQLMGCCRRTATWGCSCLRAASRATRR